MTNVNKSLIIFPVVLLSGAVIATEPCNEGAYLSVGAGVSKTQSWKNNGRLTGAAFKTGINARVAVGHRFCSFRVEFEPSYINLHRKTGDNSSGITRHMRALSTLGNLYYHFPTYSSVAPYIGVGAGFSSIKADYRSAPGGPETNISTTKFAYQGIVGASFALNQDLSINIDYRYFQTEKFNQVNREIRNHSINLGLSYFF